MPQTVTIGTEGTQSFAITQACVSRRHARITVGDDGTWTLEDLRSTNGTYVRDEADGTLRRVGTAAITPLTFIVLGTDDANGCSFYACRALAAEGSNYMKEFQHLRQQEREFQAREEKADRKARTVHLAIALVSLLAFAATFVIPDDRPGLRLWTLRVGTAVSSLVTILYDPAAVKRRLMRQSEAFHACPNPACTRRLTRTEIINQKCAACGAH